MILHLVIRHGLTTVALQAILKLVNNIFGMEVIPNTLYFFNNIFKPDLKFNTHFYCKTCENYLGSYDRIEKSSLKCDVYGETADLSIMNENCFFLSFPIAEQLKLHFENSNDILSVLSHRFNQPPSDISDIYHGTAYSKLSENGILKEKKNISLTLNTDGSPVFKSSKNSMWPIQFRINELPISERFILNNIMNAGIWFGKADPNMTIFLTSFIKGLADLYENGFQ